MAQGSKKILVLTAGFGEGHNTAARNVRAGLLHVAGDSIDVEVIDAFADTYGETNEFTRKLYIDAINKTPKVWQRFYNMLDKTRIFERTLFTMSQLEEALGKMMTEKKPDIVCTTYPIYAFLFNRLYPDPARRPFRLINVVTDSISVNSLWYRVPSDEWLVPNTQTADVMRAAGVPEEKVKVFGFPVQLDFHLPGLRQTAPDPGSDPRILYIINSGKLKAPDTVQALLQGCSAHLTVVAGRDAALKDAIEAVGKKYPGRVEVLGWTDQMPRLMMTHNLVITKAGGATVQEALAACCPLIINQVVPGQEEGNWELVRRIDAGALASSPEDVGAWAKKALANNAALAKHWHQNLVSACRADSSVLIARHLLNL